MDGVDFVELLTGDLAATLTWAMATPCPCTSSVGSAQSSCLVCGGTGWTYGAKSQPFQCGLVSQDAKARAALAQTMGPGMAGDAVVSIPMNAPCYDTLAFRDRLYDQMVQDGRRSILTPGTSILLPPGATNIQAFVKNGAGTALVAATPPVPDAAGRVMVSVTTTLVYSAPRTYEVLADLSRVRSFGSGMPKKWSVKLLDLVLR